MAFLFVYSIWNLEQRAIDKDMGLGRLCTLGELVKGMKASNGEVIGLTVSPTKDSNYNYDVLLIGNACVIRAVPRAKDVGAFAMMGSPSGMRNDMYYNPKGPDLTRALKVSEMGFEGKGFSR